MKFTKTILSIALSFSFISQSLACENKAKNDLAETTIFKNIDCWTLLVDEDNFRSYGYNNPNAKLSSYNSVLLEKITIEEKADSTMTAELLTRIKNSARTKIRDEVQASYSLANSIDSNVMKMQVNFRDAALTGEGMGVLDFLPIKVAWNLGKKALNKNTKVPFMVFESRITDSVSGELVRARIFVFRGEGFEGEMAPNTFESLVVNSIDKAFEKSDFKQYGYEPVKN